MSQPSDPRIAELEELAREEGITLPMPASAIVWFEERGCIVDLMTGQVYRTITITVSPNARAVAYLLSPVTGFVPA